MQKRAMDDGAIELLRSALDRERELADKLGASCANTAFVLEARDRVAQHQPYLEALDALAALPPLTDQDVANTVPDPGAEQVEGGRLPQWGLYQGAGKGNVTPGDPHSDQHSAKLTATELHQWGGGKTSINVALMAGPCNGFDGPAAPPVTPFCGYHYSFWLKGTAPRVVVSFVTWDKEGKRESRSQAHVTQEPFAAPGDWTFYSGSFVAPVNAERGALKIGIDGFSDQGGGLGEICVDDVYVGMSKEKALQGGQ